jgi:hypothetical protein
MRLPRPRLTIRRLMILVAIGGVLIATARSTRRFRLCMQLADNYAWLRSREPWARGMIAWATNRDRLVIEASRGRAEYYARLSAKYRFGAWCFWETIPRPDPPPL